ncbi:MAG: M23 family metallopeptidase [Candidatus Nanopelagicales bacterium]
MRRARVLTAAVALALVLAPLPAATAAGPVAPYDIDSKVSDAADDLAAANTAVARAMKQLEAVQTGMPAAQAALTRADAAVTKARAAADAATAAQLAASAKLEVATAAVAKAQDRIVETNGEIGDLVRAVYTQGPYAELAAILSADTPSDFAAGLEAVRSVSRSQNRALAELQAAKAALALAQAQAQVAQDAAATAQAAASASLAAAAQSQRDAKAAAAKVASLVAAKKNALAVAAKNRASVKRQYDALKAEQQRLRQLERSRTGSGGGGYSGKPSGSLDWPIPGASLVGGVGWRVHPVYGYRSCHTGLDIRGSSGTPIHAPAAGRVIAILNGGAYGLHTLVDHGGGLVTMYAHQSGTAVRVGQTVARGQVIGYVGSSGWVTGPHLHWEVHVDGVPYDPLGWFGSPRVPVPCWKG